MSCRETVWLVAVIGVIGCLQLGGNDGLFYGLSIFVNAGSSIVIVFDNGCAVKIDRLLKTIVKASPN